MWLIAACEPAATEAPVGGERLSGPDDADEHYPPGCSELGPAACTTPCQRDDDAAACLHLAEAHLAGFGVPWDPPRGIEYMRRSCSLGLARGCGYLAAAIEHRDPVASRRHAQQGCELGYGGACLWFVAHHVIAAVPPDWSAAAPWVERGCKASHGRACLIWGDLLRTGQGVGADPVGAKAAYDTACELGETPACALAASDPKARVIHELVTENPPSEALIKTRERGHVRVSAAYCVQNDGSTQVGTVEGGSPKMTAVVRDTIARWRFAPTGSETPQCSSAVFDLQLE